MLPYDYSRLNGAIIEFFGTQAKFSEAMGLSERSISLKLNGKVGWKQSEIAKACKLLHIHSDSIANYFFKLKIQY